MKKTLVPACLAIALGAAHTAAAQQTMPPIPVVNPQFPLFSPPSPVFGQPLPVYRPQGRVYRPQVPVYKPQVPPGVTPPKVESASDPVNLAGPRFGMTFLGEAAIAKLQEKDLTVAPVVSQFGWQFERRFYANNEGLAVLTEGVVLVGGLEQGVALPSFNWLVGVRSPGGAEFGLGPNLTPLGVGLVIAAGTTFKTGALNIPVNLAVVPSKTGVRVSFLTGFNIRSR